MMEFKIIDLDCATKEEILEALEENRKTAQFMTGEIERLKKLTSDFFKYENSSKMTIEHNLDSEQEDNDDLEEELNYYIEKFNGSTIEELMENSEDILPSFENGNYQNIILRLRLETLKTIKEISNIIKDSSDASLEEIQYYREELEKEKNKLHLLSMPQTETKQSDVPKKNRLVFATTQSGNIRVLEDIDKRIPREYYPKFYDLFSSILNGTFKNVKRLVFSSTDLSGFSEVKDHKVRVVFDRVGPNTYAIITAFMKKSDKDKGYLESLVRSISDYKINNQKVFKDCVSNPEFMDLQQQYEVELFDRLGRVSEKGFERVKVNATSRITKNGN